MKAIVKITIIICTVISLLQISSYACSCNIIVKSENRHNLEGAHYYHHYKNGVDYKKYKKPEFKEKQPFGEEMRERYNDKNDYNNDIDRLNNINIERGNEIKIKFRNEKNINIDYNKN